MKPTSHSLAIVVLAGLVSSGLAPCAVARQIACECGDQAANRSSLPAKNGRATLDEGPSSIVHAGCSGKRRWAEETTKVEPAGGAPSNDSICLAADDFRPTSTAGGECKQYTLLSMHVRLNL